MLSRATKKSQGIGVITTKYVDTLQGLCRFTSATSRNITDVFNEFRCSLGKGGSTSSISSPSRRPRGSRGDFALQRGSGDHESFDRPCTWELGEKQCWLVSELQPWNRVLSRNCIELQEHSWGELTLQGFHTPESDTPQILDVLRSSLIMHLLLRQHRCITRLLMDQTITHIEMAIFWHALQNGGAGIRYLEFTGSLSYQYPAQWLEMLMWSHSVACLPVLHSLRVSRVVFDEDVAHTLGSYLLRTTTLQCIDINNVQAKHEEASVFLSYLANNKTVTSLKVQVHFVMATEGEALAHVLQNHVSLENLEINGTYDCTPSAVLRAAVQSSSLKSLTVRSFIILTKDIEAMAAALMRHPPSYASGTSALAPPPTSRMESLTFLGCPTYDLRLQRALAALIGGNLVKLRISMCSLGEEFAINAASRLRFNSPLRVLDMKNSGLSVPTICILVCALEVNSTLEMMAFNLYGTLPDVELLRLFNTIREVGASPRIHVSWCKPRPLHFARGGALCRIPSLFVDLDNCSAEDAAILLEPLASGTNVTSACIQCSTNVDDTVVQQLVNALANTKSVRTLSLQLDWPENSIVNVLRSLEQNCSVSVLEIDGTTFRKRAAKALARLVVQNRMLNKIFMNLEKENCECPQLRTVCRELKEAMPRNRFLTNVAVNLQDANHASDVVIKDALRRNKVFINEAVHFIKGSNEKKEALAFETLQYSRSVVTDLCTGAVECDEARAKKQIDEARCRLALNYFIFTGVVKAKVVCRLHPKRKPRFDKLGKDMQARICSYLSLTDVIGI